MNKVYRFLVLFIVFSLVLVGCGGGKSYGEQCSLDLKEAGLVVDFSNWEEEDNLPSSCKVLFAQEDVAEAKEALAIAKAALEVAEEKEDAAIAVYEAEVKAIEEANRPPTSTPMPTAKGGFPIASSTVTLPVLATETQTPTPLPSP